MAIIEIQTIEGGRLKWVGIYSDTNQERAVSWGNALFSGIERSLAHRDAKPNLRILDKPFSQGGKVIGAWQRESYEAD